MSSCKAASDLTARCSSCTTRRFSPHRTMLDEEAESAATQIISGVGVHGCSSRSSNDCRGRAFRVHAFKSMEKSTARTDVPFPAIRATGAAFVCARPPARPTRVAKGTKGEAKCTKVQHKCIKKVLVSFCHSAALSAKVYQSGKTHAGRTPSPAQKAQSRLSAVRHRRRPHCLHRGQRPSAQHGHRGWAERRTGRAAAIARSRFHHPAIRNAYARLLWEARKSAL